MRRPALRFAALLTVIAAVAAAIGTTHARAVEQAAGSPLDVEIAVDSTGSMGPLIAQARTDAQSIIAAVLGFDPNARFSVVAFRDVGYAGPEYEVLQPFTANTQSVESAIGRLKAIGSTGPGNVPSEGYNLMFDKSVTDGTLGWRAASRKVVVVLGDGEPHGAGAVGLPGCGDTNPDPHGLNTVQVLAKMRAAGRTLLMVRQKGQDATLGCYDSIASLAAPGSAARDAGSSDLAGPIKVLLEGAAVSLESTQSFPVALPGGTSTLTLRIENRSGGVAMLDSVTLGLPVGTSLVAAKGQPWKRQQAGSTVTWVPSATLAPGSTRTLVGIVRPGSALGRLAFRTTVNATLDGGRAVAAVNITRLRVGHSLIVGVVGTDDRSPATGAMSFAYPASAVSLVGSAVAKGQIQFGTAASRVTIKLDSARITAASSEAALVAHGVIASSKRPLCRAAASVTVKLVDRDARIPRLAPDLVRVSGSGCTIRAAADVIVR